MMQRRQSILLVLLAFCLCAPAFVAAQLSPIHLRCEYAANPLGIEATHPRFSWLLQSANPRGRGQRQTAYRISVASSPTSLAAGTANLWDSGKVRSDRMFGIEYAGKPLTSRQECWWRVQVWDEHGRASAWSKPAMWEMGLLKPDDWRASWISAIPHPHINTVALPPIKGCRWIWLPGFDASQSAPVGKAAFRRVIDLPNRPIRSSTLYLAVDNSCRVYVNGHEAGSGAGWQRVTQLDVAPFLNSGRNTLAILAENSGASPNPAGILGAIVIMFGPQDLDQINLDSTWRVSDHPAAGWERPGFDDSGWPQAHAFLDAGRPPWGVPAMAWPVRSAYFRREFGVTKPIRRARAYVCGLGYYELTLNGTKVGDRVLEPAQTDYEQRSLYSIYDVTRYMRSGRNMAGLLVGNGWYNQDRVWGGLSYGRPCAICQIEIEFADGSHSRVCSDATWQSAESPIRADNVYAGETYDAQGEIDHWSTVEEPDRIWDPVRIVPSPTHHLVSEMLPPNRRIQEIRPVHIVRSGPRSAVYDFGQNFAGWVRLHVRAPAGTEIHLRFAETVNAHGNLDTASTGVFATQVEQVDRYVCKGGGEEVWEPRFTYHGFRYVEITGLPGEPKPQNVIGVVVHTHVEPIGTFTCSDPMLNRIHRAALWTQRSNLHGHPTDCPARERCGWLGDAQITAEMTYYNWDMSRFWPKYVGDILTSWRGERPGDVAPGKRGSEPNGHVDWGLAVVFIPWYQYLYSGDERHLREMYPLMVRFIESVRAMTKDGVVENGYGDWCPPGSVEPVETPPALTTTAWFYHAARILERASQEIGKDVESGRYRTLAEETRRAFNRRFFDESRGTYSSQTANAMSLALGLVPPDQAEKVGAALRSEVVERHEGHLATGIFGSRYLYDALCQAGYSDVALGIFHQTTYPSHGDLFRKGATTLWECWGEPELDKKWGARSLNHPMQGGFDAWFYQGLGGIRPLLSGFRRFELRPQFMKGLQWARVEYRSVSGKIVSKWKRTKSGIVWDVTVPPNTTAQITVTAGSIETPSESDKMHHRPTEFAKSSVSPGRQFEINSGSYRFVVR